MMKTKRGRGVFFFFWSFNQGCLYVCRARRKNQTQLTAKKEVTRSFRSIGFLLLLTYPLSYFPFFFYYFMKKKEKKKEKRRLKVPLDLDTCNCVHTARNYRKIQSTFLMRCSFLLMITGERRKRKKREEHICKITHLLLINCYDILASHNHLVLPGLIVLAIKHGSTARCLAQ